MYNLFILVNNNIEVKNSPLSNALVERSTAVEASENLAMKKESFKCSYTLTFFYFFILKLLCI